VNRAERAAWKRYVMGCPALQHTERLILLALETFADFADGTGAHPGWAALADICNLSRSETLDAMKKGRDLNLIERTARGARKLGHADTYRLVPVQVSKSAPTDLEDDFKVCEGGVSRSAPADPTVSTTVTTKKDTLRVSKESSPTQRRNASESADTADTSDAAHPGGNEDPTTQGEEPMKHDPDQDGLPGMLIPLPTNRTPATVPDTAPATREQLSSSRTVRGSRLPEDWTPPLDVIAEMRAECPHVDQKFELRKFRDYWIDKTGKDAMKRTWVGTYRNWIRKAAGDCPRNGSRNGLSAVDEKALGWQGIGR
jgi:hypothetical protein